MVAPHQLSDSDAPGVPVVGSPAITAIGAGHFLLLLVVPSVISMGALTLRRTDSKLQVFGK